MPAGAGHVFDDARRIARQVAADIARDHAGVKIEGAAGRITDDDGERFVLVEILRLNGRRGQGRDQSSAISACRNNFLT